MSEIEILGAGGAVFGRVAGVADPAGEYERIYRAEYPGAVGWREYVPPDPPITARRAEALARLEREAEAARAAWSPLNPGLLEEYQFTAAEAARWAAEGEAGAPYPFLQADVDAGLAPDLAAAVASVTATAAAYTAALAAIRTLRKVAQARIAAASTAEEIEAALVIDWPRPA